MVTTIFENKLYQVEKNVTNTKLMVTYMNTFVTFRKAVLNCGCSF
jgi:hypothetical protein